MAKLQKLWRLLPEKSKLAHHLSEHLHIPRVLAQVLVNRGIEDEINAQRFLFGNTDQIRDPFILKDMDKAVERIHLAISNKEKIVVFGDYDVDGITASALLIKVLRRLQASVDYYIPERQTEGYGLNAEALQQLQQDGASLIITVDCGISAYNEVNSSKKFFDFIITDHHQPPEILPEAYAIINPKQTGCSYQDKNLAGVGVAFKLCQALWHRYYQEKLIEYLDIVAIGTIADIVPLIGENRVLVKSGLEQLMNTSNVGLQTLIEVCGLKKAVIDSGKVGFVIAPRLNAAGRLSRASAGVELLITENKEQATILAENLNEENARRQAVEKEILCKAESIVTEEELRDTKVVVIAGDEWHSGVIGIVASRFVDKYYKPTIIISIKDGIGKGSCRSIPGFDMYAALTECADILVQYGGHHQAAGLTVSVENITALRNRLNEFAEKKLTPNDYIPVLNIDAMLPLEEINSAFLEQLACLAPYGMGNPNPIFACDKINMSDMKAIGQQGRHLKFRAEKNGISINGISWEMGELVELLQDSNNVDIAFQPEFNEWNGQRTIQLLARDIQENTTELSNVDKLFLTGCKKEKYDTILKANCFYTKIVGVTFNNRQDCIKKLQAGQELYLRREPDNPVDANAIQVVTEQNEVIGYLRAELAKELAKALDSNIAYRSVVVEKTGGEHCAFGVNILISRHTEMRDCAVKPFCNATTDTVRQTLIGNRQYHESQMEVLDYLARGQNTMCIMGTGRGKSAIFQSHAAIIALQKRLMTIIIYPLRALVNDQYLILSTAMLKLGLHVYKGNGTLSPEERTLLFEALKSESVDILLATPEFIKANMPIFQEKRDKIGFFVVDECHHMNRSGQQRPVYRQLRKLLDVIGNPLVLCVTATADNETVLFAKRNLGIQKIIVDKTVRSNLLIKDARTNVDKCGYLVNVLMKQQKTLIFVNSRKMAYDIAGKLRQDIPSLAEKIGFYHAGLTNEWRNNVENWFREGILQVVVATSAFGEGVDLPGIRHVIQYHLPFNLTTFNQQCGRAGRDGNESMIHLLFNEQDIKLNHLILKNKAPERQTVGNVYLSLKQAAKKESALTLTNQDIAARVKQKYHEFVNEDGVGVSLRILEELNLLWRESAGARRTIFLAETPSYKLDIGQSMTYYEGKTEKSAFAEFAEIVMNAEPENLLQWINRPLYPKELVEGANTNEL